MSLAAWAKIKSSEQVITQTLPLSAGQTPQFRPSSSEWTTGIQA
ncbi:hypothetical protein [Methyloglobulus morosus]|nr:hypothetical protein [Methyloglobulus morosus]